MTNVTNNSFRETDEGGTMEVEPAKCPECGSYRISVTVTPNGEEVPTRCGQCGWRQGG